MLIEYRFEFDGDQDALAYTIDTENPENGTTQSKVAADWTLLSNCQCSNCPLKKSTENRCPAAVDMQQVIEDFGERPGLSQVDVYVITSDRDYHKKTGVEEGLRSLMGLIMANSECPILTELKPMAYTHLPFSSQAEFILRSVGSYLVKQHYLSQNIKQPDWELKGLIALNQELRLVNQAMWQRIHGACKKDSNLKALLSFFAMSSSVSYSLEAQLSKIKHAFLPAAQIDDFEGFR
jgi:hypothetical protein